MKYALICPNQPVASGFRVADIVESKFEVASPLFWVACVEEVQADLYWYNPEDASINAMLAPADTLQPLSEGAQTL